MQQLARKKGEREGRERKRGRAKRIAGEEGGRGYEKVILRERERERERERFKGKRVREVEVR